MNQYRLTKEAQQQLRKLLRDGSKKWSKELLISKRDLVYSTITSTLLNPVFGHMPYPKNPEVYRYLVPKTPLKFIMF